jgi:hypothetical protein
MPGDALQKNSALFRRDRRGRRHYQMQLSARQPQRHHVSPAREKRSDGANRTPRTGLQPLRRPCSATRSRSRSTPSRGLPRLCDFRGRLWPPGQPRKVEANRRHLTDAEKRRNSAPDFSRRDLSARSVSIGRVANSQFLTEGMRTPRPLARSAGRVPSKQAWR